MLKSTFGCSCVQFLRTFNFLCLLYCLYIKEDNVSTFHSINILISLIYVSLQRFLFSVLLQFNYFSFSFFLDHSWMGCCIRTLFDHNFLFSEEPIFLKNVLFLWKVNIRWYWKLFFWVILLRFLVILRLIALIGFPIWGRTTIYMRL